MTTLKQLSELTGAELHGDPDFKISGVADLVTATSAELSFFANPRYLKRLEATSAGAVIIPVNMVCAHKNRLIHTDPHRAFQKAIEHFIPAAPYTGFEGIHPSAVVHPTAIIDKSATIGPNTVIDANVSIGSRSQIHAGCFIGPETSLGEDCEIHANVTIREKCTLGNRVTIQSGTVIGSNGLGYAQDNGKHVRLKQVGGVTIEDDVEVGACTAIERGHFSSTRLGEGTKIDDCVLIGHNVSIGKHCIIAGQSAVAGSTAVGDYTMMGGQVGVDGHLTIGPMTRLAARSGVTKNLEGGKTYSGTPAMEITAYNKQMALLRKTLKKFS